LSTESFPEMLIEESGDLLERFLRLGRAHVAVVVGMRLPFIHLERRLDSGLAQLAMHAHRAGHSRRQCAAPLSAATRETLMLKGIDPLLSADLLWILAAMGHGDDLAIVDGNHPAEAIARATTSGRLVCLPGITMERAVAAILTVFPVDDFAPDPVRRMEVVGKPEEIPPVQRAVQAAIEQAAGRALPMAGLERHVFYVAARSAFAVVQCIDPRPYGCFLIRKGVITG